MRRHYGTWSHRARFAVRRRVLLLCADMQPALERKTWSFEENIVVIRLYLGALKAMCDKLGTAKCRKKCTVLGW